MGICDNIQPVNGTFKTRSQVLRVKKMMFCAVGIRAVFPDVSNKYYHGTGSYQLSAQHKEGLVSVSWENVISAHGEAMALNREYLGNLFFVYLCLY